jgi:membrane-bound lytic murein transglycosylase MltF
MPARPRHVTLLLTVALTTVLAAGCGAPDDDDRQTTVSPPAGETMERAADVVSPPMPSAGAGADTEAAGSVVPVAEGRPVDVVTRNWTGDLDGMVARRVVRALVVPTQTHYFIVNGRPQGIAYEMLEAFEKHLNARYETGARHLVIHVVFVPTTRDDLIPALEEGRGDLAVAALTITPERQARADFSAPIIRGVDEILVTGPAGPAPASLDDLAGLEVNVRPSSSYYEHLKMLSARFVAEGRAPIRLRSMPEQMQDADLMELVDAGVLGPIVVDDYKARLWAEVFPNLVLHPEIAINRDGEFGWMMRKGSPLLKAEIDRFARKHRQGTLFGNTVLKRYTASTRYIRDAVAGRARLRFDGVEELFRGYARRYDLDPLLLLAMGYQESRLRQGVKSRVGAVGIMQVMPNTGRAMDVGDIGELEANVHAGIKYLRYLIDRYFDDDGVDELNQTLFAMAAYNAGPSRITRLRRKAAEAGLDPDLWFGQVERLAAREIGRETVRYVANIFKYYYAYRLLADSEAARQRARGAIRERT